jgi:hypothetical protein
MLHDLCPDVVGSCSAVTEDGEVTGDGEVAGAAGEAMLGGLSVSGGAERPCSDLLSSASTPCKCQGLGVD